MDQICMPGCFRDINCWLIVQSFVNVPRFPGLSKVGMTTDCRDIEFLANLAILFAK